VIIEILLCTNEIVKFKPRHHAYYLNLDKSLCFFKRQNGIYYPQESIIPITRCIIKEYQSFTKVCKSKMKRAKRKENYWSKPKQEKGQSHQL